MRALKFTRHNEWYEPKLIPLLGVGYLVIYLNGYPLEVTAFRLLFLIFSIMVGAIFVSVINDVCDIEQDVAAGKSNRMEKLSRGQIAMLLIGIIGLGFCCGYYLYPDKLSMLFYAMSWIIFTLYSVPPFRFKERGILGVFCDASGAHLFPTLLIISNLTFIAGDRLDLQWTAVAAGWAFFYGLRGILWHQFYDRDNDIVAKFSTFATGIEPANFKLAERGIFLIELLCFSYLVHTIINVWFIIAIVLYLLLMIIKKRVKGIDPVIIITQKDRPFSILMHDFYLVFFPLTLLWSISLSTTYGWILLAIHVVIFPRPVYRVAKGLVAWVKV
ncbi:UbiA family prenyltransferase [Mucilaginibacter myungsuensis]|uniref:UbiA family prenyltransferase n=1 Tax=Mucilaginibacter myungsuensis TaxID=649104 RepID=A0A929L0Y7_9SPHI|nr:UbiA family prenyltransferase [Mucilaginibacter myungsuensis]MBE9664123.1 UbiA family prenyltransferase [Mucilaginibacter myungsuensis]MDN3601302.1 UbiA family prenyltransferase [Mucilaginibacter myungsuensis]